jgi:DNA modification methylase
MDYVNKLFCGDALEILPQIPAETVDLCYIDPPYNTGRDFGDFNDKWKKMEDYIEWQKARVQEIWRVLKPTGSIYLLCDYHANAYIKIYVLDKIFGEKNFRNEIIWKRSIGHNDARKKLGTITDVIFLYTKSKNFTFNPQFKPLDPDYVNKFYRYSDDDRLCQKQTSANTNFAVAKYKLAGLSYPDRNGYKYEYKGYSCPENGWRCPISTMERYEKNGELVFPKKKSGRIYRKYFLRDSKGKRISNLWDDIPNVGGSAKERTGYMTQKPEKLLERIIKLSSNEGDIILDCFCGSGTTCAVANKLGRKFIGIDVNPNAIEISKKRLETQENREILPKKEVKNCAS